MIGRNGCCGVALEATADLDTVEVRHHDVEQDQVGTVLCHRGQRLLAVGGLQRRIAMGLEPRHDDVAVDLVVIDDEDARGIVHGYQDSEVSRR